MRDSDELGSRRDRARDIRGVELAGIRNLHPFQHGALALPQEMPRHDIGMMLHDAEHDLIARLYAGREKSGSDQIDRFRAALGEDDLILAVRIEETLHPPAGLFVALG